jgi:NADP-dependent 3-hydroxy acid dehydrogenase YdfG
MTENFIRNFKQKINGLNVLVTGGTTGIGRETAMELAALGANVLICGTDQQHLDEALKDSGSRSNGELNGILADTSRAEGVAAIFEEADKLFDRRLDVLINNAALAYQDVTAGSFEDIELIIRTNILGYLACTKEAIQRMKERKQGHIINIGSMSADVRETGSSVYVTTKSGVQGFSESLRKEVNESGIKVTLIEPGAVGTDMQPVSQEEQQSKQENLEMLVPDDIAGAVLYALAQPARCDVIDIKIRPHLQLI